MLACRPVANHLIWARDRKFSKGRDLSVCYEKCSADCSRSPSFSPHHLINVPIGAAFPIADGEVEEEEEGDDEGEAELGRELSLSVVDD